MFQWLKLTVQRFTKNHLNIVGTFITKQITAKTMDHYDINSAYVLPSITTTMIIIKKYNSYSVIRHQQYPHSTVHSHTIHTHYMYICMDIMNIHIHPHTHAYTYIHTTMHTHIHRHINEHTLTHISKTTPTCAHKHTCIDITHIHTNAYAHTHIPICTDTDVINWHSS